MELMFINHDLGYDCKISDDKEGVYVLDKTGKDKYFKFDSFFSSLRNIKNNEKLVLQISFTTTSFFYVLERNGELIGLKQDIRDKNSFYDDHVEIYDKHLKINKTGIATLSMYIFKNNKKIVGKRINGLLSRKQQNEWIGLDLPIYQKKILGAVKLKNRAFFITYYPQKKAISLSKVFLNEIDSRISKVYIRNRSNIEFKYKNQNYNFDFRKKSNGKGTKIFGCKIKLPNKVVLTFTVNKHKYYAYSYKGKNFVTTNPKQAYGVKTNLKVSFFKNSVIFYGRYNNSYKKLTGFNDYIFIKGNDRPIGKFKRLFSKRGKSFVFAIIPLKSFTETGEIHRGLYIGNEKEALFPFYMTTKLGEDFQVFSKKKVKKNVVIFRANVGDGTSCTILPFSQEYSYLGTIKQWIAKKLETRKKDTQTNVYFEKFSEKADESAIKVFEKVVSRPTYSDNYFILSKECKDYVQLKKKFGKKIVKKYSLLHYRLIYRANCFISTEFSNHIINDRIFINHIRTKITNTPLIFLQHGIMFAKPIENPMAAGFRKKNVKLNLKKIVISSKLEAKEFYKVGYNPDDLLLTGLATFDNPVIKKQIKYSYMPTYRYWEEHMVYENRLEETSYYRDIKNVIQAFEKNNLLDKLLIVPHNKFANYIISHFPDYKDNICTNPSEALTKSKIFITDYSSAIYDAINRGSYPIFWWKEKDILIEKYHALPSLNEETAPGPIAYNEQQLIDIVLKAEKNDFQLSPMFKQKYKNINNFSDNRNTDRIIEYLRSEKII